MMFSVVVPVFNKAEFLLESVRSILSQDFSDLEVLVIDDGSTDGGVDLLSDIPDARVRVFRRNNMGVSVARNFGISCARGYFVCFLDADDIWAPSHLTRLRDLISSYPDSIAWATGYAEFDSGNFLVAPEVAIRPRPFVKSGGYNNLEFLNLLALVPFFCTCSIVIPRLVLNSLQPCFPPGEQQGEDLDLWFRISELGTIQFDSTRDTVFYRRNVIGSLTSGRAVSPLPAILRMFERSHCFGVREKVAARRLLDVHFLHLAWNNFLLGFRSASVRFLFRVNASGFSLYWLRIAFCLFLPTRFVLACLSFARRGRI